MIVRTVALTAPGSADALDEQLETVSAQIAPGLFRSLEISLPHEIQISRRLAHRQEPRYWRGPPHDLARGRLKDRRNLLARV